MDLRELGALFKEERERRGLSQNDVIEKIKIGRSILVAIEEGEEGGLPHPVYAKGFIKNYAKLLDLDPDEIGDAFARALGEIPESRITPQHELNEPVSSTRGFAPGGRVFRYFLGAVLLLAVAVGVLWSFSLPPFDAVRLGILSLAPEQAGSGETGPSKQEEASSIASDSSAKPVPNVPVAGLPDRPVPAGDLPVAATAPPAPPQPAPQESVPAAQPALSPPPAPAPTVQPGQPASAAPVMDKAALNSPDAEEPADPSLVPDVVHGEGGAHNVTIVAAEECWIDVASDGGPPKGVMLTRGMRFVGRFNDTLLVRLGNAAGVKIRYDDKDYPLHANPGEVKTLKFVAKQTSAPAAPAASATPAAPGSPAASAAPAVSTPAAPQPSSAPETPAAPAIPDGMRKVEIVGMDGSWVLVIPDGGKAKEIFVKKGETVIEPYKEKIEIKLGNPSSVLFRHEGQEYPVSTQQGEKKSVHFPNS
ncbi:MAG: RodZ domain-containing protein [Thermodesulfobacteriota bacterium]